MIKKTSAIAALAIVLFGGSAFGQQQYDSLGSPAPAPNQQASPTPGPNVPIPGNRSDTNAPATTGAAATDGSGASGKEPASERNDGPNMKAMGRPAVLRVTDERQAG
jgi:hypothetical protein